MIGLNDNMVPKRPNLFGTLSFFLLHPGKHVVLGRMLTDSLGFCCT